jgi:DNA-binding MarR family transcriptional regulator
MGRVVRRVQHYYERHLSSFGLTPAQFFVLDVLWTGDAISIGELSERVALDTSTLTGLLDRMERSGLVQRTPNPADRRSLLIVLTERARQLKSQVLPIADALDSSLRTRFGAADISVFERVLDAFCDSLKDVSPQEEDDVAHP